MFVSTATATEAWDPKETEAQLLFMHYKNVILRLKGLCFDGGLGQ